MPLHNEPVQIDYFRHANSIPSTIRFLMPQSPSSKIRAQSHVQARSVALMRQYMLESTDKSNSSKSPPKRGLIKHHATKWGEKMHVPPVALLTFFGLCPFPSLPSPSFVPPSVPTLPPRVPSSSPTLPALPSTLARMLPAHLPKTNKQISKQNRR